MQSGLVAESLSLPVQGPELDPYQKKNKKQQRKQIKAIK